MRPTRLVTLADGPVLAELNRTNRDFLAPWEPLRDDGYFTPDGQRADVRGALERHEQGVTVPHVILDDSGRVVGRITRSGIVRGPLQSCSVGYWVSGSHNGRGLATAAVHDIKRVAFEPFVLHVSGPAGATYVRGSGGDELAMDAVTFCSAARCPAAPKAPD